MNFQPLGDRIIIKPLEAESKTKGGILLPDTVKEKHTHTQTHTQTHSDTHTDTHTGKHKPVSQLEGDRRLHVTHWPLPRRRSAGPLSVTSLRLHCR